MLNRLKNRVTQLVSPDLPPLPQPHHHSHSRQHNGRLLTDKFTYSRPGFLQLLSVDELKASADHNVRPIIVPRDISVMPWNTGYVRSTFIFHLVYFNNNLVNVNFVGGMRKLWQI